MESCASESWYLGKVKVSSSCCYTGRPNKLGGRTNREAEPPLRPSCPRLPHAFLPFFFTDASSSRRFLSLQCYRADTNTASFAIFP